MEVKISKKDASALAVILAHVGGHPEGPRGAASRLMAKLYRAGVEWPLEEHKYITRGMIDIEASR